MTVNDRILSSWVIETRIFLCLTGCSNCKALTVLKPALTALIYTSLSRQRLGLVAEEVMLYYQYSDKWQCLAELEACEQEGEGEEDLDCQAASFNAFWT